MAGLFVRDVVINLSQPYIRRMAEKKIKVPKPPYEARPDADKIRSQWTKLSGLDRRKEPSAAIVRAATAAELSVNLAIRAEFAVQSELTSETIDAMLKKANGLWGKMAGLLLPLVLNRPNEPAVKKLRKLSEEINKVRNDIVHSGKFSNRPEALKAIEICRKFSMSLVQLYEPGFSLKPLSADALEDVESEGAP
jgi:hypothetical protein